MSSTFTTARPNRTQAVAYAASILVRADDWQEAQHALADHPTLGPWLQTAFESDEIGEIQSIIRDAEELVEARGETLGY